MLDIIRDNWLLLLIGQYPYGPLGGIAATLILSVLGIGLAFPLSVALALARLSPYASLRWPVTALVYATRGIPLLMIILWTYFLLPLLLGRTGLRLRHHAVHAGAVRGLLPVRGRARRDRGAAEGAGGGRRSLGHGYWARLRFVILPQALFNMLPSMLSQFISTVQDTTLGYVINVQELTFAANQVNNQLLTQPFQVFFILAVTYFVVCFTLTHAGALPRTPGGRAAGWAPPRRRRTGPPICRRPPGRSWHDPLRATSTSGTATTTRCATSTPRSNRARSSWCAARPAPASPP